MRDKIVAVLAIFSVMMGPTTVARQTVTAQVALGDPCPPSGCGTNHNQVLL